jgi:uncharacterized protein YjbJ (UPF0337 family)
MAIEDKARHTAETARGATKHAVGRATGNRDMQAEGKIEQVLGHLKQAGESVLDAVHSAIGRK